MFTGEKLMVLAKASSATSYTSGIGTAVGAALGWLNEHGVAVGAICAIITALGNLFFRWLDRQDRLKGRLKDDA